MRRAVLALTSLLFVLGTIGSNIGPALVDEHPLAVISLSSRNRNLFASVPFIDWPAYAVVGFLRVLIAAVALFYVGRWYGDRTVSWVEANVGEPPLLYRWMERAVDRAGWLALFLMPGSNVVCLLVGHRKMNQRTFFLAVIPGIAAKLVTLWIGGQIFEDQVRTFLNWIERYQWWIVVGLFAVSALQMKRRNPVPPEALESDVNVHDAQHPHRVEDVVELEE